MWSNRTSAMQTLFWIAVFASVGSVAIALTDLEQWEEFKKTYGKHYPHPATDAYHYAIFQQSLREVEEHNAKYEAGELTYSIKLIHLSDIPQDQWPVLPALPVPENFVDDDISEDVGNTDIPDAIDWREKGYVTHVKDQGTNCDGSYIFAVIGSLEAFSKRVNGDLVTLSEQNIRECYQDPTSVCNGQSPSSIIRFIVRNQSSMVESEHNYPFNRTFGQCKFSKTGAVNTHVQGHKFFFGEDKLKEVVGTVGPVIVIIRASPAFRRAHNGVFYDPTCKKTDEIDHAVLVVGYGTESGKDYWIIKNSWGTFFGDGGYLKMARNRDGNCHIGDWAIYPV